MYGMVNRAIEDLVTRQRGPEAWARVCALAGVETPVFVSSESYPDRLTFLLVGAAAEELDAPVDEVLRRFGVHWILRTAAEGYGELMDAGGRTLGEFLDNLPAFHTRVVLTYPDLKPPEFTVTERGERRRRLRYESSREGLQPFVEGLLEGLGQRFGVDVSTEHVVRRGDGADHDEFVVVWRDRKAESA